MGSFQNIEDSSLYRVGGQPLLGNAEGVEKKKVGKFIALRAGLLRGEGEGTVKKDVEAAAVLLEEGGEFREAE